MNYAQGPESINTHLIVVVVRARNGRLRCGGGSQRLDVLLDQRLRAGRRPRDHHPPVQRVNENLTAGAVRVGAPALRQHVAALARERLA